MTTFPKNIILIGMPGAGKSTVGVLLAKRLGLAFVDTDILIQVREGRSLQALIQAHGAEEFCRIEENHLLSLSLTSHVIAPGGSAVYSPRAMTHLKANGIAVHLDIAVERLKRRLDDVDARGVVIAPGQTIEGLFAERRPLYLRYADATIETDGLTPDQVVGRVLQSLTIS
ncbi:MAG TPA: shikimate kinase [Desulfobacterales bacterium]|nr:shikimate kinase [Desulfobacterales bacterium]